MKKVLSLVINMIIIINYLPAQNLVEKPNTDSIPNKVFQLGEVTITESSKIDMNSRLSQNILEKFNKMEVSRALNIVPGVSLTASGPRNESMVSLRGFDLRAVPVFMDGIPVYIPYDGYVDLSRFTTFDLSAIDVSKGFSSMLYGPNSLGGAINLISRKPLQKLEYDGSLGLINTNGYKGNINIGTKWKNFFAQGGYSYLHRNSYNMSKQFISHAHEDGGERENSYRTDQKINLKVGWTPNESHEYAFGYINQHGQKGTPVYAGDDKLNSLYSKPRYWQWPNWDKETYYFLSNTKLNDKHYVKSRLYYDIFKNSIKSYDDSTYSSQNKRSSFTSFYNDYTYGGSVEYGTNIIPLNHIKLSFHYKEDVHRENNSDEPVRRFEDNTISMAFEDNIKLHHKLLLVPGISYNVRQNLTAQDYKSASKTIFDYAKANPSNAFNMQLGIFYYLNENHKITATAAQKTRFATIKDRYSYRMGTAIPNPDLKPETADMYDISYNAYLFQSLNCGGSVFYSNIKDAILSVANVEPGKSQMQNTGRAEFMGFELFAQYTLNNKLQLGANYSYIERNNLSHPNVLFTDVPYTKVISFIQYQPIAKLSIIVNSEYNSLRYSTSYGTKAPEYVLLNSIISYRVWKYISVEAGINNIFDKNYMLTEGYPEEGRNFFLTMRFFNH